MRGPTLILFLGQKFPTREGNWQHKAIRDQGSRSKVLTLRRSDHNSRNKNTADANTVLHTFIDRVG